MAQRLDLTIEAKDKTQAAFRSAEGAVRSLGNATQEAEAKQRRLTAAVGAVRGLAEGNVQSINSITGAFGKMGNAIAGAGLIIGTAVAAWKTGLKIQEALWKRFVDSVESGAAGVKASFESLGKALSEAFAGNLKEAGAQIKRIAADAQAAVTEINRVQGLRERRAKAEAAIAGGDVDVGAQSTNAQQDAEAAIERLRREGENVASKLLAAEAKAAEARAQYERRRGMSGGGDVTRALREANTAAQNQLAEVQKEAAKASKDIADEIEEQQTRIIDASAAAAMDQRAQAEKAAKSEKERLELAEKRADIEKQLVELGKQDALAGSQAKIANDRAIIEGIDERMAGAQAQIAAAAMTREQKRTKDRAAADEENAESRAARIRARIGRGARVSGSEREAVAMDDLKKQMARDAADKKVAEENIRMIEARLRTIQHQEAQDERRLTRELLRKNLQASGGL